MHTCVFLPRCAKRSTTVPSVVRGPALGGKAFPHPYLLRRLRLSLRAHLSIARAFSPHTPLQRNSPMRAGRNQVSISITPSSPAICAHCCSACKKLQKRWWFAAAAAVPSPGMPEEDRARVVGPGQRTRHVQGHASDARACTVAFARG